MNKIRIRNWLIILFFLGTYLSLEYFELGGFWSGFAIGLIPALLLGELYWLVKGKDIKYYLLGERTT